MKEKFTPGPWIALESHPLEGSECYWIKCQPSPVLRGFVQEIGTVNGPQSGAQKANAHLIAAAPVLFEALTEFMATYAADENTVDQPNVRDCWRLARLALAKARGDA